MATAHHDDVSLYYETDGSGETVAFLGEIGYGAWQWGWQHAALTGPYETLVTDLRGVGRSDAPPGPYAVDDLAADVQAVLQDHGVRSVHLVGVGLGGMVALELARISSRPRSLTLVGTAGHGDGLSLDPLYGDRDDPISLENSLDAAFSRDFLARHGDVIDQIVEWRAREDATREAWEAQHAAVQHFDVRQSLYEVDVPALVLHGTEDGVWPPERGRSLADGLPRGECVPVEGAGHLCNIEHSKVVNDEILRFLESVE